MAECRVALMHPEQARETACELEMVEAFADLNIFRVLLHRPRTAKALSELLLSLLFGGELDDRLRELLIMRIGWKTGSDYEWTQHWSIAQQQFGCSETDLLELRDWRSSNHFGELEQTILEATDQLLDEGDLNAELFSRCVGHFGRNASIEMVTAVGVWRLVSKLTKALEIPLEEGISSWPPDGVAPPSSGPTSG